MSSEGGPPADSPTPNRNSYLAEARLAREQERAAGVEQEYHDLLAEREKTIASLEKKTEDQSKTIERLRNDITHGKEWVQSLENEKKKFSAAADREKQRAQRSEHAAKEGSDKAKSAQEENDRLKKQLAAAAIDVADLKDKLADQLTINHMLNEQVDELEDGKEQQELSLQQANDCIATFEQMNHELDEIYRGIAPGGRTVEGHLQYIREKESERQRRAASQASLDRRMLSPQKSQEQDLKASRDSLSSELQGSGYSSNEDEEEDEDTTLTNVTGGVNADAETMAELRSQLEGSRLNNQIYLDKIDALQKESKKQKDENDALRAKVDKVQKDVHDLRYLDSAGQARLTDTQLQREHEKLQEDFAELQEVNAEHKNAAKKVKAEHQNAVYDLNRELDRLRGVIEASQGRPAPIRIGRFQIHLPARFRLRRRSTDVMAMAQQDDFYLLLQATPIWLKLVIGLALMWLFWASYTATIERNLWVSRNDLARLQRVIALTLPRRHDKSFFAPMWLAGERYLEVETSLPG